MIEYLKFYEKYLKSVKLNGKQLKSKCPFHPDDNPSFSVNIETGQFNCFGCKAQGNAFTFAEKMKIKYKEVPGYKKGYNKNYGSKMQNNKKKPIKYYDYKDISGELLYQVVRYEPKDFKFRHPDKNGGWIWDLKGVCKVPYRLNEIIKSDKIIIVEGEKDVDNLVKHNFNATTCSGGAGKWNESYNRYFKNKEVILIPDNDKPGKDHMETVKANLKNIAKSIKICPLPDSIGEKADVSDFLEKFGPKDLNNLIDSSIPETEKDNYDRIGKDFNDYPTTDYGNAEAIVSLHGEKLRWDNTSGEWLIFNGNTWQVDKDGEIKRIAINSIRERLRRASDISDNSKRNNYVRWAVNSESRNKINAAIEFVKNLKPVTEQQKNFDRNYFLLGCKNGVLDLRNNDLLPGKPEMMISKSNYIDFDSRAICPRWEKFLDEIFESDRETIDLIQRSVGYTLTGDVSEQVIFILWGSGSNGKSTFLDILLKLMGDYGANTPFSTLEESQFDNGKIPSDVAALCGKRFVSSSEIKEKSKLNEARIKSLTGGDPITARFLHKEYFTYNPTFKIWFSVNHKPKVNDNSYAFWRRVLLIPFNKQFKDNIRDNKLKEKLLNELPGILNWAVKGCFNWQKSGLNISENVRNATNDYQNENDYLKQFLNDCTVENENSNVESQVLHKAYLNWAKRNNEPELTSTMFGRKLKEIGIEKAKDNKTRRIIYNGLEIINGEIN